MFSFDIFIKALILTKILCGVYSLIKIGNLILRTMVFEDFNNSILGISKDMGVYLEN